MRKLRTWTHLINNIHEAHAELWGLGSVYRVDYQMMPSSQLVERDVALHFRMKVLLQIHFQGQRESLESTVSC